MLLMWTNCCNQPYMANLIAGKIGGGGSPPPPPPDCTVFCLVDTYTGGEQVNFFTISGSQVATGGLVYTDSAAIASAFDIAFQAVGCVGNLSGYTAGGLTGVEASYAFGAIDLGCYAESQDGDINGTFIAMACDEVTVAANFNVGGGGQASTTQIESMTVNGFRFNFSTSPFNSGAVIEAEITAKLKTIWGLTVTSVAVTQLGGGNIRVTIVSNGTVESLTWDGTTTGSATFI